MNNEAQLGPSLDSSFASVSHLNTLLIAEHQTVIGSWTREAENVWIVGGGSGHGFKHGPVIGEMVADALLGAKAPPPEMGLGRLLNVAES